MNSTTSAEDVLFRLPAIDHKVIKSLNVVSTIIYQPNATLIAEMQVFEYL